MELIKPGINFDFVGKMNLAFGISLVLIAISIASIVWHGGLNYGIDFAGGTLVQIRFQKETPAERIHGALKPIGLENSIIQSFGPNEVVIRVGEVERAGGELSRRSRRAWRRPSAKAPSRCAAWKWWGPRSART